MKILSIGNSFSQDAQRYLHRLAKNNGTDLQTANLCIGGCSLETHYLNTLDDVVAYDLERNGENANLRVSMRQMLESDGWDVVTLQQASCYSAKSETYFPYIEKLAEYVRRYCPRAKIFMHETWAYEENSERLKTVGGYNSTRAMLDDIQKSYAKAAAAICADGIIPSGTAMYEAVSMGLKNAYRDTFHASFGVGRYLLALTWYKTLTGQDIAEDGFDGFDEPVTGEERAIARKAANVAVK